MIKITKVRKKPTSNPIVTIVKISRLIEIMILGSIVSLFILIAANPNIADATLEFCGVKIVIGKREILKQLTEILKSKSAPDLEDIQTLIKEHISKLKFDDALSKEMRQLQRDGKGPFQGYSREVQVIWNPQTDPLTDPIKEGSAAVCQDDILYHEDLMFFNTNNLLFTLRATQFIIDPCKHAEPSTVHISYKDASKLLNNDSVLLSKLEYKVTILSYAKAPEPVPAHKSDMIKLAGG